MADDAKLDIYMRLYVGDYLADTRELSAEEHGAYLLLLMSAWTRGGRLPKDPLQLARLASVPARRWTKVWGMIGRFFSEDGDGLVQRRLSKEIDRARRAQQQKSTAGSASAESRRVKAGSADPFPFQNTTSEQGDSGAAPENGKTDKPTESLGPTSTSVERPLNVRTNERGNGDRTILDPDPKLELERERDLSPPPWPGPPTGTRTAAPRVYLAAKTTAFLAIAGRYPNPHGENEAAQVWAELAASWSGGERELGRVIWKRFDAGFLKRHPYSSSDMRFVPKLATFLANRSWEERDPPKPAVEDDGLPEET